MQQIIDEGFAALKLEILDEFNLYVYLKFWKQIGTGFL